MLRLVTDRFDPPALDTAVSAALLQRVASGLEPPTLRIWRPERSVAFGRQDRARPGYPVAVGAVAGLGFAPVERLAGGRAAVFHEGTIAFSWAMPESRGPETITARFEAIAGIVVAALAGLGFDARIGEVPGEYCPGEWSVNLGGTHKVMGVGQRLVRGAAHVGGVVVVAGADLVNQALTPAYAALEYEWLPESTGALERALAGVTPAQVAAALVTEFGNRGEPPEPGELDPACLDLARTLAPDHDAAG